VTNRLATISSGPPGWILASYTYDEEVKNRLRRCAGKGNYRWVPETKVWCYRRNLLEEVQQILEDCGYEVHLDDDLFPVTTPPTPTEQDVWVALFRHLPEPLTPKVYRAAVLVLHPDQGGNTAAMQSLNLAWERFTKQIGRS
jgi:hypothetical protein